MLVPLVAKSGNSSTAISMLYCITFHEQVQFQSLRVSVLEQSHKEIVYILRVRAVTQRVTLQTRADTRAGLQVK